MQTPNTALKVALFISRKRQVDVADKAGVPESTFSKIINGRIAPNADQKSAIARALRMSIHELFPEEVTR